MGVENGCLFEDCNEPCSKKHYKRHLEKYHKGYEHLSRSELKNHEAISGFEVTIPTDPKKMMEMRDHFKLLIKGKQNANHPKISEWKKIVQRITRRIRYPQYAKYKMERKKLGIDSTKKTASIIEEYKKSIKQS